MLQEVVMNSKNLTQAHVRAADILTELYTNLREDQVLLFQMSGAIWRKVSVCHPPHGLMHYVVESTLPVICHCLETSTPCSTFLSLHA